MIHLNLVPQSPISIVHAASSRASALQGSDPVSQPIFPSPGSGAGRVDRVNDPTTAGVAPAGRCKGADSVTRTQVSGVDGQSGLSKTFAMGYSWQNEMNGVRAKASAAFKNTRPELKEFSDLLSVQMEMSRMAFGVEIGSKVVEHSLSGIKTIMQTQA